MKHIEVMQQALEWFEWFHAGNTIECPGSSFLVKKNLKEALKEHEMKEVTDVFELEDLTDKELIQAFTDPSYVLADELPRS